MQEALAAAGAEFHLGRQLVRLEHARSGLCASLDDGRQLHADLLLAAIGLRPRTRLASQAGLAVGRGIQVDRLLRSSQPHIYALGDCAEVAGHSLLYVMPLMAAARALARTLAGEPTQVSYGAMPITVKTPACPLLVAPPSGEQPGQWQFTGQAPDLRGEYRLSPAWRLQARLSNLLDADYQTVDGFNQPGRGAWLTLRYNAL